MDYPIEVTALKVGVLRNFFNDVAPHELHQQRAKALHVLFDADPFLQVNDWGQTDDATPHEYVELLMKLTAHPELAAAASAGLGFVSGALGSVVADLVKDGILHLLRKVWNQNRKQPQFEELIIEAGPGVIVRCKMKDQQMHVTVQSAGQEQTRQVPLD